MMRTFVGRLKVALVLAVALLAAPAGAHHSFEVHYVVDPDALVAKNGTIKRFSPRSPHTFIVVSVADSQTGEDVDWVLEAPSNMLLTREGWPFDRLVSGAEVAFTGYPARNGSPAARLQYLSISSLLLCGYYCEEDG